MAVKKPPADDAADPGGLSRRAFIKTCGTGTLAYAMGGGVGAAQDESPGIVAADAAEPVTLHINGEARTLVIEPRWSLLFVLREQLGLTAAKAGCERGECGACTVLIDDQPRYACLTLAIEAEGRRIETAEGLTDGTGLGPVQQGFAHADGLQCGYCTPGQVMAAEGLLRANPDPSFEEIRAGMSGNLCRCGTYAHIFNAVADAAKRRRG